MYINVIKKKPKSRIEGKKWKGKVIQMTIVDKMEINAKKASNKYSNDNDNNKGH